MSSSQKKILIVDDEQDICQLLKTLIELHTDETGIPIFQTELFSSGNECINRLKTGVNADLVISDIRMNDGTGIDLLKFMNDTKSKIPLFFISGFSGGASDKDLLNMGAKKVYGKPFKQADLISGIKSVLQIS